jgi:MFS family permease
MAASLSPLRNPAFRKLFTAQIIALVGTGLSTVALTLLAYDLAGGDAGVVLGTALAFKMIAYVVFAPVIGGLAHRFPRKALLISLDVVRAILVLAMPFVTQVWQIYALIFFLNLFSAGFKPVFAASIPDVLPTEEEYTKALSYSRLAYDLESLLSPLLAGLALFYFSYSALFVGNSVAFIVSAGLIVSCAIPMATRPARSGSVWDEVSFGMRAYMATPRLRALLSLYVAVSAASAMIIVNTVVFVRDVLELQDADVAMALAAAGFGSMLAALAVPKLLEKISDRALMLSGSVAMGLALLLMAGGLDYAQLLIVWLLVGIGMSMVQTPAGRIVNRSAAPADRPAYFSAQFALSHACWLVAYPLVGALGAQFSVSFAALVMGGVILASTVLAWVLWPRTDGERLQHVHAPVSHLHPHTHDPHHEHEHDGSEGPEPHVHPHKHEPVEHAHPFVIDDHHRRWPTSRI